MPEHGTLSMRINYNCTCALCRRAATEHKMMKYYERKKLLRLVDGRLVQPWLPPDGPWRHGMYTTYQAWSCRCWPCTEDNSAARRRWRETGSWAR